jgi:hypothetical protein
MLIARVLNASTVDSLMFYPLITFVEVVSVDSFNLNAAETSAMLAGETLHPFPVNSFAFTNPHGVIVNMCSRRSGAFFADDHSVNFTIDGLVVIAFNYVFNFRFHV